jgi:PAS domain S-box-containing protein
MSTPSASRNSSEKYASPGFISLVYAGSASLWIVLSDLFLKTSSESAADWFQWSALKGLAFVLATAGLLHFLLRRHFLSLGREAAKTQTNAERFHVLFEGLGEPAFLTGPDRSVLLANSAAKEIFPATEGLAEGNFLSLEDYLAFGEKIRQLHKRGGGRLEWRLQTRQGQRDFRIAISPLPNGDRYFLLTDVTDLNVARSLSDSLNRSLEARVAERTAALELANEALQKSEETFRSLFENAGTIIAFLRSDRTVRLVNPAGLALLGYSREAMEGIETRRLHISAEKYDEFARVVYPGIERDGHWNGEWPFRRRNGEILWLEWSFTRLESGELLCIGHDLTARKEAESALRESEARFRWLIETMRHLVWTTDPEGRNTFLSQSWRRFTGHDPARLSGDEWSRVIHPEDAAAVQSRWKAALAEGSSPVEMEFRIQRDDGDYHWMNVLAAPMRDGQNRARQWMAVAWDIQETWESRERIRRSEERYRRLVNLSPYGIEEVDTEGRIHFANPALARIFGMEVDEITGKTIFDLVRGDPEELRRYFHHLRAERPAPTPYFGEYVMPSGELRFTQVDWDYVVNDADELEGFAALISDVTQRRRDEAAVREAKENAERHALRAESANRSKSLFLANMTHEIRTPMNAILGYCQILQREPALPPHSREQVDIMYRSGEHLLELLNDILDMSKIEAGRAVLNPQPTDLIRLLRDMEEMFRPKAEKKGLAFRLDQTEVTIRRVTTDRSKFRQVLINLLGNAFKFTRRGSVTLRLQSGMDEFGRVAVSAAVSDTGRGISPEELETVFDAFSQGGPHLEEPAGTGLGLAISREFVRLMGGDLVAEKGEDGGAVFRLHIEAEPAAGEETGESQKEIDPESRLWLPPGAARPRVLVAEDRKTNRDILVRMLEGVGAEVHTARDGGEAVTAWERLRPELILMDLRMPVMDGLEATRRILEKAPAGGAPVVVAVTASVFDEDRSAVLAAGCRELLPKPFRLGDILAMLRDVAGWKLVSPAKPSDTGEHPGPAVEVPDLDSDTRRVLLGAIARADARKIDEIIGQLEKDAPSFAKHARELMDVYDYDGLTTLLNKEEAQWKPRYPSPETF